MQQSSRFSKILTVSLSRPTIHPDSKAITTMFGNLNAIINGQLNSQLMLRAHTSAHQVSFSSNCLFVPMPFLPRSPPAELLAKGDTD